MYFYLPCYKTVPWPYLLLDRAKNRHTLMMTYTSGLLSKMKHIYKPGGNLLICQIFHKQNFTQKHICINHLHYILTSGKNRIANLQIVHCAVKVIRKFFLNHNKSFRWHLGDYEKHIFFRFEGL